MTGGLVLDASAAIAILRREPARFDVMDELRESARLRQPTLVPDIFWLEVANVLGRRHRFTPTEIVNAIREVDDLGLTSVQVDRALLLVSIDLAGRHGLSAYDAAYLALAEVEDARLLTLDQGLAAAAGPRAIPLQSLGPHRLAEQSASYVSEPVDWARFGTYLAQLRAEAQASRAGQAG
jgi:predicted nucleic acid-binding protein